MNLGMDQIGKFENSAGDFQTGIKVVQIPGKFESLMRVSVQHNLRTIRVREAGSISNLGGTTLQGHFSLKKKGHFLEIKRALLCLLQNLGGHVPQCPMIPTSMCGTSKIQPRLVDAGVKRVNIVKTHCLMLF